MALGREKFGNRLRFDEVIVVS